MGHYDLITEAIAQYNYCKEINSFRCLLVLTLLSWAMTVPQILLCAFCLSFCEVVTDNATPKRRRYVSSSHTSLNSEVNVSLRHLFIHSLTDLVAHLCFVHSFTHKSCMNEPVFEWYIILFIVIFILSIDFIQSFDNNYTFRQQKVYPAAIFLLHLDIFSFVYT